MSSLPRDVIQQLALLYRLQRRVDISLTALATIVVALGVSCYVGVVVFALSKDGAAVTACVAFGTLFDCAAAPWLIRHVRRRRKRRRRQQNRYL